MSNLPDEIRALISFCFITDMTYNSDPVMWTSHVPEGNYKSPALLALSYVNILVSSSLSFPSRFSSFFILTDMKPTKKKI
jgi:hypothetical protein